MAGAALTAARLAAGGSVVGAKTGLASPAVQAQLGADQSDFGALFDDMAFTHGDELPMSRLLQPKEKGRCRLRPRRRSCCGPLDVARGRGAVEYAGTAREVGDSCVADGDITFGDTAASGFHMLGSERRAFDDVKAVRAEMRMLIAASSCALANVPPASETARGAGLGSHAPRTTRYLVEPLRPRQVVPLRRPRSEVFVHTGAWVAAEISGVGTVTATSS